MTTVKLSYTILNAWQKGKFEDAIASYLGKEIPETPYMKLDKLKHKQWANYTMKTKSVHKEVGGEKLINPIVEQKYEKLIPFSDDIQILWRGVIDLEDQDVVDDYKCGRTSASTHINGWQLDSYKLLRPNAKLARYRCFNPYTNELNIGVKFLHKSNAEKALENIITFGGELIDYLQTNRLLIDYKGGK